MIPQGYDLAKQSHKAVASKEDALIWATDGCLAATQR